MIATPVRRNAAVLVFASCVLLAAALSRGACAAESAAPLSAPETTAPAAPSGAGAGAPADVAPAPVAAAPATEEVANPYGLAQLWSQGDPVARGTMVVLLIMSIGTWYIAISKLIEQTRVLAQARAADATFWNTGSVEESIGRLKESNAFRQIAERGLSATEHHEGSLVERIDLHTWVTMSIQRSVDAITARLQRGLAFLATVGSTAPFIGLFGTVWGIYHALVAIGLAGQASIDKVAGPVGEALIMTAIGLFVAVPAVLAYNWLVRRNKAVSERVKAFSSDLHSVLLSGAAAPRPARAQQPALRAAAVARTA
ncbi:MAG TPA: MotA/TolQ/ExbB proton channel family protein [Stellaceae bacterium]|nr:MotA/TolQ/ExbB proton channel family protein [Stellaceae bacterium]